MTQQTDISILRRKTQGGPKPAEAVGDHVLSPERVLRLALERATDRVIGLAVSVTDIGLSTVGLDGLLAALDPQLLLVAVSGPDGPAGLVAIDVQSVTAIVECQIIGRLVAAVAATRGLTGTDLALVQPVLAAFLADLSEVAMGTDLAGWADGLVLSLRIPGPRAVGMLLADGAFRLARMTLDFGVPGRFGTVILALPLVRGPRASVMPDAKTGDWSRQLRQAVMAAPAELIAVLHRMRLPLRAVEGFAVGQVIALNGTTVGSVRLEGPDGATLAQARLGQAAGLRAVRIEGAAALQMRDSGLAMPRGQTATGAILVPATVGPGRQDAMQSDEVSDEHDRALTDRG